MIVNIQLNLDNPKEAELLETLLMLRRGETPKKSRGRKKQGTIPATVSPKTQNDAKEAVLVQADSPIVDINDMFEAMGVERGEHPDGRELIEDAYSDHDYREDRDI